MIEWNRYKQKIGDCNWITIDCQWSPIKSNDRTVIDYPALVACSHSSSSCVSYRSDLLAISETFLGSGGGRGSATTTTWADERGAGLPLLLLLLLLVCGEFLRMAAVRRVSRVSGEIIAGCWITLRALISEWSKDFLVVVVVGGVVSTVSEAGLRTSGALHMEMRFMRSFSFCSPFLQGNVVYLVNEKRGVISKKFWYS